MEVAAVRLGDRGSGRGPGEPNAQDAVGAGLVEAGDPVHLGQRQLRTLTEITLLCAERPKPQKTGSAWMHLATLYRSLSLLHNQTQPIFLIVDQHSSHRAKAVQEFVASTDGHLELFFLPPYSPELNPDELVWNHLKTHGVRKRLLQTPQELKRYVLGHMRSLQRTPALLRGFFKKPSLRYITA